MAKVVVQIYVLVALFLVVLGAPGERIYGGQDARPGQFPYMVSVQFLNNSGIYRHTCGGSIITNRTILTAAHCINTVRNYGVYVDSNELNGSGRLYEAETVIPHPKYTVSLNIRHDVGVVHLKDAIDFTPLVQPVELDSGYVESGILVRVSGWGYKSNETNVASNSLQYIDLMTIDQDVCAELAGMGLPHHSHFCTLNVFGEGICDGDSGSPFVRNGKQIGVVSWSSWKCARGYPDGAARVSTDIGWIRSVTK